MRCTHPTICIWYMEPERPKQPYCTLKDMEIKYTNIEKIENCKDHKTAKQVLENWENIPCI